MPTQPINQNNHHAANERLGNRSDPDPLQKTTGKYSGRTVASDDDGDSPELSHKRDEIECSELTNNKKPFNDSFGRNDVKRHDSGFESSVSDNVINESIELLSFDSIEPDDLNSLSESDRSGGGESDSENDSESDGDESTMTSGMRRKNALRFAVVLKSNEIEVLKRKVMRDDIDCFVKSFDGLKGDFFHTGDYLVEHIDELILKIQKRYVKFSDVSNHAGQLVFWWNLLCKEAQNHLLWCECVELGLLEPEFIQSVEKRKKLEKKRLALHREYLDRGNSKARDKAVKAQKDLNNFKSEFYLPKIEKLKNRLYEMPAEKRSRQILGKCYNQLSDVLQGNVRNIVSEVDKWTRNLLLNRIFIESGLKTDDIIR